MSDRRVATHWVRLLGPIGTAFTAKYALNEVQAGLLPIELEARDSTKQQDPSGSKANGAGRGNRASGGGIGGGGGGGFEKLIIAVGSWNVASPGARLTAESCRANDLNSLAGAVCSHLWRDSRDFANGGQEHAGQHDSMPEGPTHINFEGRTVSQSSNGFVATWRRDGSVMWMKGVGGWSEAVSVATWHGFCADAQGYHQAVAPTVYLKSTSGLGSKNVRRCSFVTAVGNLGQNNQPPEPEDKIDVGVTRQPRDCSRAFTIGAKNQASPALPCSGVLRPQGVGGDVWLVKWELATGLAEYAKLLGSRDSHETAASCAATDDGGVLLALSMVSPFSNFPGTGYDTLGLSRSGRQHAPGCRIENPQLEHIDQELARDLLALGFEVTLADFGAPNLMPANLRTSGSASCIMTPHAPFYESGLIAKVRRRRRRRKGRNSAHDLLQVAMRCVRSLIEPGLAGGNFQVIDGLQPTSLSASEQLAQDSTGLVAPSNASLLHDFRPSTLEQLPSLLRPAPCTLHSPLALMSEYQCFES